ncbi:MAG: protein kinase [Acidobacteriia bacterium]|nr:protein kinase [Terriglobia bacterium]
MKADAQSPHLIRFESFEVNLRSGELRRDGERLRLPEQSFLILTMLLERPGEVVMREEIQKRLWPNDTVVEFENSINAAVKRLRLALEDSADQPRYIETLARRGYRWMVRVERSADPAPPLGEATSPRAQAQPPTSNLIGRLVSHYRVLEILGGGGMGIVYRAEDVKLGRSVALKFLPEEMADDLNAMRRFEREARTASALNHPGICTIYEIEEDNGQPFIVMELLKGQTLRELIEAAGSDPLPVPKVLDLAKQIVAALDAAHSHGIIHRDIKPANIHVTAPGQAKILDFGLAKLQGAETSDVHSSPPTGPQPQDLSLSRSGEAMGTAGYMSPEQVRGEKLDARADIYSFGLVLYEMATGRRAFMGDSISKLHAAILEQEPVPTRKLNPRIPAALDTVITTAMQKDREARYPSAARMLEALKAVEVGGAPIAVLAPQAVISEEKKRQPRKIWKALVVAAVALAVVVGAYYVRQRQATRLTAQDTIVLADFANSTGDPVFDDTLKQATRVALRQSPFLNILSDRDVHSTLKLMTRPPNTALTPDIARELCQRAGSKAYVAGAIGTLGSEYVLGLKAVNCLSGSILSEQRVTAADKDKVLDALGDAVSRLRSALGESLVTVQTFDVPLPHATTVSLEALKAYTLGNRTGRDKGPNAALPYYLRAVQLDPNFAMVYLNMGSAYTMLGQSERASEYFTRAYQLRDHATERESLIISGIYQFGVNGDLESAIEAYKKTIQNYPNELPTAVELATAYARLGKYDKAIDIMTRRQLDDVNYYEGLGRWYVSVQRFADAKNAVQQAQSRKLDSGPLRLLLYAMAFLEGDAHEMQEEMSWLKALPGATDQVSSIQADTESVAGHLSKADTLINQAVEFALKTNDDREGAGLLLGNSALREAEFGDLVHARQDSVRALKVAPGSRVSEVEAALALAMAGDAESARSVQQDLKERFPSDTQVQSLWLPTIAAQVALGQPRPAAAIDLLQNATQFELGYLPNGQATSCLHTVYVRGQAYLVQGDGRAAAGEFQKILDHNGIVWNCPTGALAHLGLARANALQARTEQGAAADAARTRALAAYQDFFTLWKDADPDIPILKQAKVEFAKLQ